MPFQVGSIALHDDGQHLGSAKRDTVDGVAGLGPGGNVLAIGPDLELTRDGSENIEIVERTSGNIVFRWTRVGVNDFECRVNCGGVACVMQNDSMKDIAGGIAGLDGSVEIPVALLKTNVANGMAGLDAAALLLLAQIPATLTGKDADTLDGSHGSAYMKRAPDYDSGCFSLAATSYVEKVHNLNTRDLLIQVLGGVDDSDCVNDGINGTGRPEIYYNINSNVTIVRCSSINNIEVRNVTGNARYYRILLWKGV